MAIIEPPQYLNKNVDLLWERSRLQVLSYEGSEYLRTLERIGLGYAIMEMLTYAVGKQQYASHVNLIINHLGRIEGLTDREHLAYWSLMDGPE